MTSREIAAAPWTAYARLRQEAPVYALPGVPGTFVVSRYDDVRAVLADGETFSSQLQREAEPMLMVFRDGASHDRLRQVMAAAFTPRATAAVEPAVRATATERLEPLLERGHGELVSAWCEPIPMAAIAQILGIPMDLSSEFIRWARDLLTISFANRQSDEVTAGPLTRARALVPVGLALARSLGPRLGGELFATIRRAVPERGAQWTRTRLDSAAGLAEFMGFFGRVLQAQRQQPQENVLQMLIHAQSAEPSNPDYEPVSDVELMMQGLALMTAGIDTTAMLLASAVRALCEDPALHARLRQPNGRSERVQSFVHEALRLWSPVQWTHRRATRDTEIAGVKIPRDAVVMPLVGSANRDPERFEAPDALRLDRDDLGYLSFAIGPHVCIGRNLALLEARLAIEALLDRVEHIALDPNAPAPTPRAGGTFGLEALHVVLRPRETH